MAPSVEMATLLEMRRLLETRGLPPDQGEEKHQKLDPSLRFLQFSGLWVEFGFKGRIWVLFIKEGAALVGNERLGVLARQYWDCRGVLTKITTSGEKKRWGF